MEADHAGITSKLEQVLTTKPPGLQPSNAMLSNSLLYGGGGSSNPTLSASNFNLNQLNDDSDFTLFTPMSSGGGSHHDLVMMMMGGAGDTASAHQSHPHQHQPSQQHKRKHSTSAAVTNNDEDSSSSWQSAIYQGRKSSASNKRTNFASAVSFNKVAEHLGIRGP